MKRLFIVLSIALLASSTVFAQNATLKVLPGHWGMKITGKGRVKATLMGIDLSTLDTSTITMNGVAAIRVQKTPLKAMAFFPKAAVMGTFPSPVEKGQTETVTVSFNDGSGVQSLTGTIMIGGKPGNHGSTGNHGNGNGNGNGQGSNGGNSGQGQGQGHPPTTHPPHPTGNPH